MKYIEIKQRRTCNGCRAWGNVDKNCTLGYKIKCIKQIKGIQVSFKPIEPCPKPLTYDNLIECYENYKKV